MSRSSLALPGEKCVAEDDIDGVTRFIIRRNDGSVALYVGNGWRIRSNVQFLQAQPGRGCTCSMLHIFRLLLMSAPPPSLLFDKLPSQPGHRISEIVWLPASLCLDRFREAYLSLAGSPYPVSSMRLQIQNMSAFTFQNLSFSSAVIV